MPVTRSAWVKGQSGNPGGRSRLEKPWTEALKRALEKIDKDDTGKRTRKMDKMARAAVEAAIAGDISAMREIGDRIEGKPAQATVVSGDPDAPIKHTFHHTFASGI